jgi:hypothetical protein
VLLLTHYKNTCFFHPSNQPFKKDCFGGVTPFFLKTIFHRCYATKLHKSCFALNVLSPISRHDTAVSTVRQPVEIFLSWLNEKTTIQNAKKVRSEQGLLLHCFGKIAIALMALVFNY